MEFVVLLSFAPLTKEYFSLVAVLVKPKSMMVCCKGPSPGILFLCGKGRVWNMTSCSMVKWKIKVLSDYLSEEYKPFKDNIIVF